MRTIAIASWLLFAAAVTMPRAAAAAQSCCVCDECESCAAGASGQGGAACAPTDPCIANPSTPEVCADFCDANACASSKVVEDACSALTCDEQGRLAIETQPAPALGSIGLALAALAAGLGGAGRLVRRRRA